MADQLTRAALLDRIANSYTSWQALVDQVPRAQMTEPGFAGAWSLKDVIAHLTVFERLTADNLEASARGEQLPEVVPWDPPDAGTADVDAENAAYHRHFRDTPLDDVLAASGEHHERLVAAVARLSESDLDDAQKYAWTAGQPLWKAIEGNSYEHYDDHASGVRAWLATHPSQEQHPDEQTRRRPAPRITTNREVEHMAGESFMLTTFYSQWKAYQDHIKGALAPLTAEQLALRAAPGLRSVGENAAHIIGCRSGWFTHFLGEDASADVKATTSWDEPNAPERSAAELVSGLDGTWQLMTDCLARWSPADLEQTFPDDWGGKVVNLSRAWVVWHVLEHDLHHGGEISLTLGMHGVKADFPG